MSESRRETLEEFKNSFWYGSRSDLHFKFLAKLSDQDAGEFFRQLLEVLGDSFDTADYGRVRELAWRWQVRAYEIGEAPKFSYAEGPFAIAPSLSDASVALMSAGGVYVEGEDPTGGETQEQAVARIREYLSEPPTLVSIRSGISVSDLRVRHPGYDIRGAARDINCIFPIGALNELAREGVIGRISVQHYSFVGAASQLRLRDEIAPGWGKKLRAEGVDVCLLVAT
jgi:hypothetical protein